MNQQININMTRKFFLAQRLGLLMLTAVLALLFWLVWLSLDPDWRPTEHRFRLREPSYVHLLEKVFEELPPWARATIVTFVPGYICWLFGSGVVSGLRRIFNREPFAVLDENGIRCWSAFGPCSIAWSEVTRIGIMPARRFGFATHTTIRIDGRYRTFFGGGHLQASCSRPIQWCLTHSMSWRSSARSAPICVKQLSKQQLLHNAHLRLAVPSPVCHTGEGPCFPHRHASRIR